MSTTWEPHSMCECADIHCMCVLVMVRDPGRQAGARSRLSGHSSRGELQITPAFSGRVSRRLPPDLPAKTFNHRPGRVPVMVPPTRAKGTSDPPFIPWNQPIGPVSGLSHGPTDLRATEPPTRRLWLTLPLTARGCTRTKMPSGANHR